MLVKLAAGALSPGKKRDLRKHLENCGECNHEMKRLGGMVSDLEKTGAFSVNDRVFRETHNRVRMAYRELHRGSKPALIQGGRARGFALRYALLMVMALVLSLLFYLGASNKRLGIISLNIPVSLFQAQDIS